MVPSMRAVLVSSLLAVLAGAQDHTADLILRNGAVYTMDAARSWATVVAIAGGRIIYTGLDAGAAKLAGPSTRIIDLNGRMVLPGFHDSHVHLMEGGVGMSICHLKDLQTPQEVLAAIRKYAAANAGNPWVTGAGWDLPVFPPANPHKDQLDAM